MRFLYLSCILTFACALCGQNCPSLPEPGSTIKAPVEGVRFVGRELPLDEGTQRQIEDFALARMISPDSLGRQMQGLADEVAERARIALENRGYFKTEVEAKPLRLDGDPSRYSITAVIHGSDTQFRLGAVNFRNAAYFPIHELRDRIPLEEGEVFIRDKVAEGLENLRLLYDSEGFINYTGVPEMQVNDQNAVIDLTISVDEGKQFRLRRIDVLGVDLRTAEQMRNELSMKPGDLYRSQAWEPLFRKYPNLFLHPSSETVIKKLDEADGQVDILLDLRKAPPCRSQPGTTEEPRSSPTHEE